MRVSSQFIFSSEKTSDWREEGSEGSEGSEGRGCNFILVSLIMIRLINTRVLVTQDVGELYHFNVRIPSSSRDV